MEFEGDGVADISDFYRWNDNRSKSGPRQLRPSLPAVIACVVVITFSAGGIGNSAG